MNNKHIDPDSFFIALITLGLFVAALFAKGMTKDLFLEIGVFLVSVKLMIMAYKNGQATGHLGEKLDTILAEISKSSARSVKTSNDLEDRSNSKK